MQNLNHGNSPHEREPRVSRSQTRVMPVVLAQLDHRDGKKMAHASQVSRTAYHTIKPYPYSGVLLYEYLVPTVV